MSKQTNNNPTSRISRIHSRGKSMPGETYNQDKRSRSRSHENSPNEETPVERRARCDAGPKASNTNNNSEDNHMEVSQGNWTQAGPKSRRPRNQSPRHKLPAIKLKINPAQIAFFQNRTNKAKEIMRCKPNVDPELIKFASFKEAVLIIATDDEKTHQELSKPWPEDAFGSNFRLLQKKEANQPIKITLRDPDADLNDARTIQQLKNQGITNATRKINRSNGQASSIISAEVADRNTLNKVIANGVRIDFERLRVQLERPVLQCYKCQQVGHPASDCPNDQACLKCSENHTLLDCPTKDSTEPKTLKCVNCDGNHAACSRKCEYLREATILAVNKQKARSYAAVTRQERQQQQQAQPTSNPPEAQAKTQQADPQLQQQIAQMLQQQQQMQLQLAEVLQQLKKQQQLNKEQKQLIQEQQLQIQQLKQQQNTNDIQTEKARNQQKKAIQIASDSSAALNPNQAKSNNNINSAPNKQPAAKAARQSFPANH